MSAWPEICSSLGSEINVVCPIISLGQFSKLTVKAKFRQTRFAVLYEIFALFSIIPSLSQNEWIISLRLRGIEPSWDSSLPAILV